MSIIIQNTKYKSILPNMTSNVTPSPYVITDILYNDYNSTIKDIYKAFDGNNTTYIRTGLLWDWDLPWVLTIDLGENNEQVVNAYQLGCYYNYAKWTMNTWTFEGSNDNITWHLLHNISGMSSWDSTTTYSYQFRNLNAYRYYRFKCTAINGDNSICLSEVKLLSQEEANLEFSKCLEDNLPLQRKDISDCIYFTDKGNIYMTKNDGTLKKMGGSSVSTGTSIYPNTELDSIHCRLSEDYIPVETEYIPFIKISGNMDIHEGLITVKKGRRVQIDFTVGYWENKNTTYSNIKYVIKDITNNKDIQVLHTTTPGPDTEYPRSTTAQYTNESEQDIQIGIYIENCTTTDTLNNVLTTLTVHEINRQIIIDPIAYANENDGIEGVPVGHIMSYMGNNAPKHYLSCDGSIYNIMEYPHLAEHIFKEFGAYNFFGGDGVETFAVPDLRGEFLRGTGTADRNVGSGGEVGEHQDPTLLQYMFIASDGRICVYDKNTNSNIMKNEDYKIYNDGHESGYKSSGVTKYDTPTTLEKYSIRPTNTSVLYCIKYEPTYYININKDETLQGIIDQLSIILDEINGEVV